jgi:hypothetical protein
MSNRRRLLGLCVLAGFGLLGACSSGTPTAHGAGAGTTAVAGTTGTTPAATLSVAEAGQMYLADITPVNATLATLQSKAQAWDQNTTNQQAESDAQPAIKALQGLETKLGSVQWPSVASSDVHKLIADIGPLTGDLEGLSGVDFTNSSQWIATFDRDLGTASADVHLVRSDLGLPPPANNP